MNDSATIEQTIAKLPRAPRLLTLKNKGRAIVSIGKYVTDGAMALDAEYWPASLDKERFEPHPRTGTLIDKQTDDILAGFVGQNLRPIPGDMMALDATGVPMLIGPEYNCTLSSMAFAVRYWTWLAKLGLSICWEAGDVKIHERAYPICNCQGTVVGAIMPDDSSHPAFARIARIARIAD